MAQNKEESAKRLEISSLLQKLEQGIEKDDLSPEDRLSYLTQLKVHGRDPKDSEPLYENEGLKLLFHFAIAPSFNDSDLEALRSLANALLLAPQTRQRLVDLGYAKDIANRLGNADDDREFLFARLLFLMTYGTTCDFEELVHENDLADSIILNLQRHAAEAEDRIEDAEAPPRSEMESMALVETLKLLFNITHFNSDLVSEFSAAIPAVLLLLKHEDISATQPLEPVLGSLTNTLLNLDLSKTPESLFPSSNPALYTNIFLRLIDNTIATYPHNELDAKTTPLLSTTAKLYSHAPQAVKSTIEQALLPSDTERSKPLGQSESLSGRLLRLSTTARTPELRDVIQSLLYVLSDNDPKIFVGNVGYGYASGFFVNHNINTEGLFPASQDPAGGDSGRITELNDDDDADDADQGEMPDTAASSSAAEAAARSGVNFVTGQYLADEPASEADDRTEDEKLREAERLFVLFERLKATGVVDVENPVETAARSGQL